MSKPLPLNREREPNNWYVEPRWVSERLFAVERFDGAVVDPCAGMGRIPAAARAAGYDAVGRDLVDRGFPGVMGGVDCYRDMPEVDNIVCNPPYGAGGRRGQRLEERFLRLALARARRKVALFLPLAWSAPAERSAWLADTPLYRKYELGPKPSCPPGSEIGPDEDGAGGALDYAWYVWLRGYDGPVQLLSLRRRA